MKNGNQCRLCGGALSHRFNLLVLYKYDVAYFECKDCRSLQTEDPYWLDEAYSRSLSNLDTGAAQRVIRNLVACYAIAKVFGLKNALDIGGGDGLLCRFLRDYGINCFVRDKYAEPTYAQGYTKADFACADLGIAFEVFEHFQNPKQDLRDLFGANSRFLLISTCAYEGEGSDWWYLAPEGGQHVFFYSNKALRMIADEYGCKLISQGDIILFAKAGAIGWAKSLLIKFLLNKIVNRILRSLVLLLPTPGLWRDHIAQRDRGRITRRNAGRMRGDHYE